MLKNIPSILSPELLKTVMEMGHGDELVIGDGNFPSANYSQRLVRLDGNGVPEILGALLRFFPLDTFVPHPVALMSVADQDTDEPTIWKDYERIIREHEAETFVASEGFEHMERFSFYERCKKAYAIVATSETALYANIILKKGVVIE